MCANKTKDAIEEEARNTQANSNGNLWYICTFHERSFAFLFFQWACIVFPLLPLLEHLTLDAGSLARFLLLFLQLIWTFLLYNFFLVQLLSFLSFSLGARCCSWCGQIHSNREKDSRAPNQLLARNSTLPASKSESVCEWEYMTTLQLLISTSISQSSTTTAEMIRFLLGEESE